MSSVLSIAGGRGGAATQCDARPVENDERCGTGSQPVRRPKGRPLAAADGLRTRPTLVTPAHAEGLMARAHTRRA